MARVVSLLTLLRGAMVMAAQDEQWDPAVLARLVFAVRAHFSAGCIYIAHAPGPVGLGEQRGLRLLWEALWSAGPAGPAGGDAWASAGVRVGGVAGAAAAGALPLDAASVGAVKCARNRPLIVVAPDVAAVTARAFRELLRPGRSAWVEGRCLPRWLVLAPLPEHFTAPLDCEVLKAHNAGALPSGQEFVLLEAPASHPEEESASLERGSWLPWGRWRLGQAVNAPAVPTPLRRGNLRGSMLSAVVGNDPPFERLHETKASSLDVSGLFAAVWRELEVKMNFTTRLVPTNVSTGGAPLRPQHVNGSWSGLVGMLRNGTAGAALNRLTMTTTRVSAAAFSVPIVTTRASVFIRPPAAREDKWGVLSAPFASDLWLTVAGALLVLAALLFAVSYLAPTAAATVAAASASATTPPTADRSEAPGNDATRPTLSDSFLAAFATFSGQPAEAPWAESARAQGLRAAAWLAALLGVTLRSAYSANLVAALAHTTQHLPFSTLEGLVAHGGYELGVVRGSGLLNTFLDAKEPALAAAFRRWVGPASAAGTLPADATEGLRRACHGGYAFAIIREYALAAAANGDVPCALVSLPRASFALPMGLLFHRAHPALPLVNYHLREMRRSGKLARLYNRESPVAAVEESGSGAAAADPEAEPVDFAGALPMLVIVGCGAAGGVVLFLVEKLYQHLRPRVLQRNTTALDATGRTEGTAMGSFYMSMLY